MYFKEWKDDYGLGGDENPMMLTKVTDVTPAKAGTQAKPNALDPGFHQSDVQSKHGDKHLAQIMHEGRAGKQRKEFRHNENEDSQYSKRRNRTC